MSATHTDVGEVTGGLSGRIHSFFCGLGGHELLLNVEPTRLSLKCMSCQYETPGWTVKRRKAEVERQTATVLMPHNIHG